MAKVEKEQVALTTIDNPYNPFENFDSWLRFDLDKGYNSLAYLGRIVQTDDQMTEEEQHQELERSIDEIVKHDPLNLYVKVKQKVEV